MKKSLRKLSLARETLRALENPELSQVFAGHEITKTIQPLTCPTNCDITMGC